MNERGLFAALPPLERLPESVHEPVTRFDGFVEESQQLRRKALEMRQQRERVARDYEQKLGDAMLAKTKTPTSPLPDYDASIEDTEHRAAGAMRAAARTYAEMGDMLLADKPAVVAAARGELALKVEQAVDALEALRPALDEVKSSFAYTRWSLQLHPSQPHHYATASAEARVFDESMKHIASTLTALRRELEELNAEESIAS
jgi:hypothetical protein